MLELLNIVDRARALANSGEMGALATLVEAEGSTYRQPGALALLMGDEIIGLLSGGCLELDVLEHAKRLTRAEPFRFLEYDLREDHEVLCGLGLGCRGRLAIFLEHIDWSASNPPFSFLAQHVAGSTDSAYSLVYRGEYAGARLWKCGNKLHATAELPGSLSHTLEREVESALRERRSRRSPDASTFTAFVPRRTALAIFGAAPDAHALVKQAKILGWHVSIYDHRSSLLAASALSTCEVRQSFAREEAAKISASLDSDAVVLMTHNFDLDCEILRGLHRSSARYIGLLGAKNRAERMVRAVSDVDARPTHLFAPIGLDVGGDAPESIALAIAAEISAVLNERRGGFLSDRVGPIHT